MKKGQIFTLDFIFATAIFLIILAGIIYLWDSTIYGIDASERRYEINWISGMVADQLVGIPGVPEDWWVDPGNVAVLGLADSWNYYSVYMRVLDADKLLHFLNLTDKAYPSLRNKLLGTGKYDFYSEFSCMNNSNRDCFSGLYVDSMEEGNFNCSNGFNFSIVDNRITSYLWGEAENYNAEFGTITIVDGSVSNGVYMRLGANDWILYNMSFPAEGSYKIWIRCSKTGSEPRTIDVYIDRSLYSVLACTSRDFWSWTSSDIVKITEGRHLVNISKTSDFVDMDAMLFTTDPSYDPSDKPNFGNFNIIPPTICVSGNQMMENSTLMVSSTKTATFSDNTEKVVRLKLIVWS